MAWALVSSMNQNQTRLRPEAVVMATPARVIQLLAEWASRRLSSFVRVPSVIVCAPVCWLFRAIGHWG